MFLSSVVTVKWTNYAEEVPAISTDLKLERSLLSIGRYLSPIQQLENRNKKLLSFFYFQFKAHTSKSSTESFWMCSIFLPIYALLWSFESFYFFQCCAASSFLEAIVVSHSKSFWSCKNKWVCCIGLVPEGMTLQSHFWKRPVTSEVEANW